MKLYTHPRSTFSRRVRLQVLEKGLQDRVALHEVDMAARENKQPTYLAINPYGRVPSLTDGSFALYESAAILDYLEARFQQPSLLPDSLEGRAQVKQYIQLCDLEIGTCTRSLIFPMRFLPRDRWNLEEQAQARAQIDRHLAILESTLDAQPYLLGDAYTLADLAYVPFAHFFEQLEVTVPAAVGAWCERILARPASLATVPDR